MNAHNGGLEAQNGVLEGLQKSGCIQLRVNVKSWIRIRIKAIRIRIKAIRIRNPGE